MTHFTISARTRLLASVSALALTAAACAPMAQPCGSLRGTATIGADGKPSFGLVFEHRFGPAAPGECAAPASTPMKPGTAPEVPEKAEPTRTREATAPEPKTAEPAKETAVASVTR